MNPRETQTGDPNHPYFEKGLRMGQKALDPVINQELSEEVIQNRKIFLRGYVAGLKEFIQSTQIELPFNIDPYESLGPEQGFLLSFSRGLQRKSPQGLDEPIDIAEQPNELAKGFGIALNILTDKLNSDAYFIGFVVGAAKDLGFKLTQFDIPQNSYEYQVFTAGLEGREFDLTPIPDLDRYDEFGRKFITMRKERVYTAGLRIHFRQLGKL